MKTPKSAAGAAEKSDEARQSFKALTAIDHDCERYAAGDDLDLTRADYDQLKAVGAIQGEWKD